MKYTILASGEGNYVAITAGVETERHCTLEPDSQVRASRTKGGTRRYSPGSEQERNPETGCDTRDPVRFKPVQTAPGDANAYATDRTGIRDRARGLIDYVLNTTALVLPAVR